MRAATECKVDADGLRLEPWIRPSLSESAVYVTTRSVSHGSCKRVDLPDAREGEGNRAVVRQTSDEASLTPWS